MKSLLAMALFLTACATDDVQTEERFSCLIRYQCAETDTIEARQYFTCASSKEDAEATTNAAGCVLAADICGPDQWAWVWATCFGTVDNTCEPEVTPE